MKAQRAALRGFTKLPSVRRIISMAVPIGLLGLWLIGLLLRLLIQDRAQELAYYFYATPPAVLAAIAAVAGAWWLIGRRWKLALLPLALMVGCGIWTYRVTWVHNPPVVTAPHGLRVLFWNTAHGTFGWARVAGEIRRHNADIVALVEGTDRHSDMEAVWREYLPEYRPLFFDEGMTLLARVEVTACDYGMLGGDSKYAFGWYAHCAATTPEGPLQVVLADFQAISDRSRYLPINQLQRRLEPLAEQSVLVLGDFNTPADSVFLKPLRASYRSAFETVGHGYAATWPVPLPVLMLDHAWFNDGVAVSRCEFGWSWVSDHRPVELEVSLSNRPPAPAAPTSNAHGTP